MRDGPQPTVSAKVCLVALPLMARSGVYRSTHDLVAQARAAGHDWTAIVGVRSGASGKDPQRDGVRELSVEGHGRRLINEVRSLLVAAREVHEADYLITMITQSDIAVSKSRRELPMPWVCYVRGLPWPDMGEQSASRRWIIKRLETRALRAADDVWATTPMLARQILPARSARLVPAGVPPAERSCWGEHRDRPVVWAGRVDSDKRPEAFVDLVEELGLRGRLIGEGPLLESLRRARPHAVEWAGWRDPGQLWADASLFIGTARREAFGRSAVEAAQAGLPMVLSDQYGAAPFLFTDPDLRRLCVVPVGDSQGWRTAVQALLGDDGLRRAVSDHVHHNSTGLTIASSVDRALEALGTLETHRQGAGQRLDAGR